MVDTVIGHGQAEMVKSLFSGEFWLCFFEELLWLHLSMDCVPLERLQMLFDLGGYGVDVKD